MKRKITKVGPSTLMVSLPAKWVKKHGLKKGGEIDLLEDGPNLIIVSGKSKKDRAAEIHLDSSGFFSRRLIYIPYIRGVDTLRIYFRNKSQLASIVRCVDKMLSFEIVEQGRNYCIIKSIAEPVEAEANSISLRLFHMSVSMGEDLLSLIRSRDYDMMEAVIEADKLANKLTRFCKRTANKNFTQENSNIRYRIHGLVEELIDNFREIAVAMKEHRPKIRQKTLKLLEDTIELLRLARSQYLHFSLEVFKRYYRLEKQAKAAHKALVPAVRSHEAMVVGYIRGIIDKAHHIVEDLY